MTIRILEAARAAAIPLSGTAGGIPSGVTLQFAATASITATRGDTVRQGTTIGRVRNSVTEALAVVVSVVSGSFNTNQNVDIAGVTHEAPANLVEGAIAALSVNF